VILVRPTPRSMIPIQNLFEVHLSVADLDRAIVFYRDALGLRLAHIESKRGAAFFWIGGPGNAMLGLWSAGSGPQTITSHTAFRASLADVLAAPAILRAAGITPLDFDGRPSEQPIVFAWMPAASVFFRDPDGHLLEFIAMLPDEPQPEHGVIPWRRWELMHPTPSANHASVEFSNAGNICALSSVFTGDVPHRVSTSVTTE
jgi:lactoylglutathione lyase